MMSLTLKTRCMEIAGRLGVLAFLAGASILAFPQAELGNLPRAFDRKPPAPSVLSDGGFEINAENEAWELTSNSPPERSERAARSGRFGIHSKLVNDGPQPSEGHLSQTVQSGIVAGETYALEFWLREIDFGISYVQQYSIQWLDAEGEELAEGGKRLTNFRAGKKDWEKVRVDDLVAPEGANGVHLLFRFVTGAVKGGSGEVFIDDVLFEPENAELIASVGVSSDEATLVWQNGDVLTGQLLPSEGRRVKWQAPVFTGPVEIDPAALDSVRFVPGEYEDPGEFRLTTVSGDILTADIQGADEESFHVFSPRFGELAISRSSVLEIRRVENPNQVFEGTKLADWRAALSGPFTQLNYRVHDLAVSASGKEGGEFVVETLVREGDLASGFIDQHVAEGLEQYAVRYEAALTVPQDGEYQFEFAHGGTVRFWLDGKLLLSSDNRIMRTEKLSLEAGVASVRLEFLSAPRVKDLGLFWSGPGFTKQALMGRNRRWSWRKGKDGTPFTRLKNTGLFRQVDLPPSFHLDLELESRGSPRFLMGLGRDAHSAEGEHPLRLETRGDRLVLSTGAGLVPVTTLEEAQSDVRLRLSYFRDLKILRVSDFGGRSLASVEGVELNAGESGILWRNRGGDLTVQRVSIYAMADGGTPAEQLDGNRPRVHLIDESVTYGRLFVAAGQAEVRALDGMRQAIDLRDVDRVVHPDARLEPWIGGIQIFYADGGRIQGRLVSFDENSVHLESRSASDPLLCSLAGATRLQFAESGSYRPLNSVSDTLSVPTGRLRGQLTFRDSESPLEWRLVGADQSVRLAEGIPSQVNRDRGSLSAHYAFDPEDFPSVMHLTSGEAIPCRISSYDSRSLRFESPFLRGTSLDARFVKALELISRRGPMKSQTPGDAEEDRPTRRPIFESPAAVIADPTLLARALTVPRINRGRPSSHLMLALNGDIKRGRLISVGEEDVRFESKQREMVVPRGRVRAVVSIDAQESDAEDSHSQEGNPENPRALRVELVDRSVLRFRSTEFRAERLIGQSPLYGALSLPVNQIVTIDSGEFDPGAFSSKFGSWLAHPAMEPDFSRD